MPCLWEAKHLITDNNFFLEYWVEGSDFRGFVDYTECFDCHLNICLPFTYDEILYFEKIASNVPIVLD